MVDLLLAWNALLVDVLPYVISYCNLIVCWFLLKRWVGPLNMPAIPTIFLLFHSLAMHMGAPFVFDFYGRNNIGYLLVINTAPLLFVAGCWLTNQIFAYDGEQEAIRYNEKSIVFDDAERRSWLVIWGVLFALAFGVSAMYLAKLGSIPIVDIVQGSFSAKEIAKMREQATRLFTGKAWRYSLFFAIVLPFVSCAALALALRTKTLLWRLAAFASAGVTAFVLLATAVKAPIVLFMTQLLTVFFWVRAPKRPFRYIFFAALTGLVILMAIYFKFYLAEKTDTGTIAILSELLDRIGRRVFWVQSYSLTDIMTIFPRVNDYLYGVTAINPGSIFPHRNFNLWWYLYDIRYPHYTTLGSAPTAFYGEVYANFGWMAMFCGQVLAGVLMQSVHIFMIRSKKTILNVALMTSMAFIFIKLALSSAQTVLIPLIALSMLTGAILVGQSFFRFVHFDNVLILPRKKAT